MLINVEDIKFYYEPKINMKDTDKCIDITEFLSYVQQIDNDMSLSADKKNFLKILASRFIVYKYEKLADYYATTDENMQKWLEKLKVVIVDSDKAIQNGYFEYFDDYADLIRSIVDEK